MKLCSLSKEQADEILKLYKTHSRQEIAKLLNIPHFKVKVFLDTNKFRLTKEERKTITTRVQREKYKSDRFDDFIKSNYLTLNFSEIAKQIGMSDTFVKTRISALNIIVPEEIKEQRRKDSYFKRGQTPFNKGVKMSEYCTPETIEKFKKNQFKKGDEPHNSRDVGYETIYQVKGRPYYLIKLNGHRKMKYKHHFIWEQANGKIPKGYNVVFKDGDTLNCNIENLECISNQENMLRNSNTVKYPKELIPTYAKIAEVNKLIKTKENGKN